MVRSRSSLMLLVGVAVSIVSQAAAQEWKSFFTGQPFTASTTSGTKFQMIFTADGKLFREPLGQAGAKGEGTWQFSQDGFCTTWPGSATNCYVLVKDSTNAWLLKRGLTVVAIWTSPATDPRVAPAPPNTGSPACQRFPNLC
jgi:hypothetical protein